MAERTTTLDELAWRACTIGCRNGPCLDCLLSARRMLLHLAAEGVITLPAARQILHSQPPRTA